jgi:hypothetical protein
MIIEIILGFSVLINIVAGWYVYKLLLNMVEITDGFDNMKVQLVEFATHLKAINKVESFYGDPTITALVEHMKRLSGEIEDYTKLLVIYEDDLQEEENEDDNT